MPQGKPGMFAEVGEDPRVAELLAQQAAGGGPGFTETTGGMGGPPQGQVPQWMQEFIELVQTGMPAEQAIQQVMSKMQAPAKGAMFGMDPSQMKVQRGPGGMRADSNQVGGS